MLKRSGRQKPEWLKINIETSKQFAEMARVVKENNLHTICSSGMCPNKTECWNRRTATFMVLGDVCTRACKFCATKSGKPLQIDPEEPKKVARSIKIMGVRHAVITSVTRDDLKDEGAEHWAKVVKETREQNPNTTIELLIPDMHAKRELLDIVIKSCPDIIGHNIETVRRLTPEIRSAAKYETSLATIKQIAESGMVAKSGIMVGLGERDEEMLKAFEELVEVGCEILTIGQYLQPTKQHVEVVEYITPEKFEWYKQEALKRGFSYVESGPLVRSSYLADKAMDIVKTKREQQVG